MSGEPDVRFDEGVQETSDTVTRRRPTLQAVLPVGRVRGAYGGAKQAAEKLFWGRCLNSRI